MRRREEKPNCTQQTKQSMNMINTNIHARDMEQRIIVLTSFSSLKGAIKPSSTEWLCWNYDGMVRIHVHFCVLKYPNLPAINKQMTTHKSTTN